MRVTTPTRSCGAKVRIGFWTRVVGQRGVRAPRRAAISSRAPRRRSAAELAVERERVAVGERERASRRRRRRRTHRGLADALDAASRATPAPQPGQTAAQYGSPLKRPSIAWSLPDEVAREVTAMSLMRIAIASPTSAPSTATGVQTSWPPRIAGVIIGPQQPGRGVPDDVAAVGDGAELLDVGAEHAVGERVDEDGAARRRVLNRHASPFSRRRPAAAGRPPGGRPGAGRGSRARPRRPGAPIAARARGPARPRASRAKRSPTVAPSASWTVMNGAAERRASPAPRRTRTVTLPQA